MITFARLHACFCSRAWRSWHCVRFPSRMALDSLVSISFTIAVSVFFIRRGRRGAPRRSARLNLQGRGGPKRRDCVSSYSDIVRIRFHHAHLRSATRTRRFLHHTSGTPFPSVHIAFASPGRRPNALYTSPRALISLDARSHLRHRLYTSYAFGVANANTRHRLIGHSAATHVVINPRRISKEKKNVAGVP